MSHARSATTKASSTHWPSRSNWSTNSGKQPGPDPSPLIPRIPAQSFLLPRPTGPSPYRYTTGSGKNSHTHHRTSALIALPFAAPHTKIGPEAFWAGIGRAIGRRDIEVESTEFNDAYRVTSDDERFAVTLLDQQMLAWLLTHESGRGVARFELWGPWLLCVSDRLDLEMMFGYLDWAQGVRSHMPVVLPSLYPVT